MKEHPCGFVLLVDAIIAIDVSAVGPERVFWGLYYTENAVIQKST